MARRKSRSKEVEEPKLEVQEVEQVPDILEQEQAEVQEIEQVSDVEELEQEIVAEEPQQQEEPELPVKRIKLIRNAGSLKEGDIINITRYENGRLYFMLGDREAYFDPSEVNRIYVIID